MSHTIDDTRLRFATVDDLSECMEVEFLSYADPLSPEIFLHLIQQKQILTCIIDDGAGVQVLGYVAYTFCDADLNILITRIAVHPSSRERGIGSKLLQHCIENAGGGINADPAFVDFVMIPNDAAIAAMPFLSHHEFKLQKQAGCVAVYRRCGGAK